MKKIICSASCLLLLIALPWVVRGAAQNERLSYDALYGQGDPVIKVATGSPGELGLLKALAESFSGKTPSRIEWYKMGSGEALEALKTGKADLIMVHAPAAEKRGVKEGWACMRTLLGSNEFYIVGPPSDPAGIGNAGSAADAFVRIAKERAKFFSRGDGSGTHKKEMKIWEAAGIKPQGEWYVVTGDFMGPTLKRADQEGGYFMTDSSTWVVNKGGIGNLSVLFKGDPILVNVYHGLIACRGGDFGAGGEIAVRFLKFMASPSGQDLFKHYGQREYGIPLYNGAEYAQKWDR